MKIMRTAVALITVALVLGPLALAGFAQSVSVGCPGVQTNGPWTTIVGPSYDGGPRGIESYSVDPVAPSTIYVTNGSAVQRTIDGGCTWEQRFALEQLPNLDVPISSANSHIVQIEIPESRFAHNTIFLLVEENVGPLVRPHVVVSRDGGSTWKAFDGGLPPATGNVLGIHVAPDSPNFIYLHTQLPTGGDEVHASTDGGVRWDRRSGLTDGLPVFDLAIDPLDSEELWFWGGGGLYRSVNGGRSRSVIDRLAPPVPLVDVFHTPGAASRILGYEGETSSFQVSQDGGRTWTPLFGPLIGNPLSITHANNSTGDVVFSLHQGVYQLLPGGTWANISPAGAEKDIFDLTSDRTAAPAIYGRTTTTIEKYSAVGSKAHLDPLQITNPLIEQGVSKLVPEEVDLKLRHDQTRKVNFELELPPQPNPVDVFFLVDTSMSMDSTIAGLRTGMQEIITELSGQGLDIQFGVGEIKDYPIPGYGDPQQGDFPYRLDTKITNDAATLNAALERLEASGGGALDKPESQLTGLYQAATGSGDPGFVPPGQDAGFRNDALPVIVNITDAAFHREPQHPSPPFETVGNELRARGIYQIGLAVYGPNGSGGLGDLTAMAEHTGTVAPTGVDCDGNGSVDLGAGQPLVCEITDTDYDGSLNLAPAIIATVDAVTEEVKVSLVPDGSDKAIEVVSQVTPEFLSAVDLKEANTLDFDVTFACPDSMLGSTQNMKLQATVGEEVVAESAARIVCKPLVLGKRDKKDPPLLLTPIAGAPLIALAFPPAPPPPVFEQFPASQSAAQAQGAMATEEQEQLQVAVVKQRSTFSSEREEIYEFSSYSEKRRAATPAFLYLSAGAMAAAYASVMVARQRAKLALQRKRR